MKKNNNPLIELLLMSVAIVAGIFSIIYLPGFLTGDSAQYNNVALNIIENKTYIFSYGYLLAPGYPFLLAIVYYLFGEIFNVVYFLQFIFLGLIAIVIFTISHNYLKIPKIKALIISQTIIFWPYLIFYSKSLLTEITFIFCFIFFVLFLIKTTRKPNVTYSIFAGFFLGLATLTRPITLLLPFWVFFFLAIPFLPKIKNLNAQSCVLFFKNKYILNTIIIILIFIVTISPWIIYASHKTGNFTPISSQATKMLMGVNTSYVYEYAHYKTQGYEPENKVELKKIIVSKIKNIYRFWKSGANGKQKDEIIAKYHFANIFLVLYKISYYIILIFAFSSLLYFKKNKIIYIIWLIVFYFWFFHGIIFQPYPRYTLPIIPLMIILAFYSFYNLLNKYKSFSIKNKT